MTNIANMSGRRNRKRAWLLLLVFLLFIFMGFYILVDILIRPMIKTYGNNQATTTATKAVNDAVGIVLSEMSLKYDDLAEVDRDTSGNIISIESNSENINRLKAAVSKKVLEELDKQDYQMVKIPMGSLIGGLLTGRGPDIYIKVPMNSTVETSFKNQFESAGINQTRHEITLDVKVKVYAVVKNDDTSVEVDTGFAIAENVLVGKVPQWMAGTQISN